MNQKVFWGPKEMMRRTKAWKIKLKLGSSHVESCVLLFTYVMWLDCLHAFRPQRSVAAHCKTLFILTAVHPIYHRRVCVSRSSGLHECCPPMAWMMSLTSPPLGVLRELQAQMAFLLIRPDGCAALPFSPKLAHLI